MNTASNTATGSTRKIRALEVKSSMAPTLVMTSSVAVAMKYAALNDTTFLVRPPSVGRTTPYPMDTTSTRERDTVLRAELTSTANIVVP